MTTHSAEINGAANLLAKAAAVALEGTARIACASAKTHYGDQSTVALEVSHAVRWAILLAEMAGDKSAVEPHAERAARAAAEFTRSANPTERAQLVGIALAEAAVAAAHAEDRALIAGQPIAAAAADAAHCALGAAARLLDIDRLIADCRAAAAAALAAAQKAGQP